MMILILNFVRFYKFVVRFTVIDDISFALCNDIYKILFNFCLRFDKELIFDLNFESVKKKMNEMKLRHREIKEII